MNDPARTPVEIAIVGAGIAGLTLGLCLQAKGMPCRIYEKSPSAKPLGVGINILPHASRVLHDLGLGAALGAAAVTATESGFYNCFGQHIHTDRLGLNAGYATPQYSIHRGDLQTILRDAFVARCGAPRLIGDTTIVGFEQNAAKVALRAERTTDGAPLPSIDADAAIDCGGIHASIRKQIHPNEGAPRYSGYNMWRGTSHWRPFLGGSTMIRAGWLATGKMVIYPIRDDIDGQGNQLINWVMEIETPVHKAVRDWNKPGRLADFMPAVADWGFDWLDVPAMLRASQSVLEFPMVDQDPLPFWSADRVTLMGDAAHPMVPRGSNGAWQAILDAECLSRLIAATDDIAAAFAAYEAERLDATSRVVLLNRVAPPDIVLKEVFERTGDRPFDNIDDIISKTEFAALQQRYKEVAGYDLNSLRTEAAGI